MVVQGFRAVKAEEPKKGPPKPKEVEGAPLNRFANDNGGEKGNFLLQERLESATLQTTVLGIYTHEEFYWHYVGTVEREAFAHMFQAQFFPEQRAIMQQYFPQALAEFERLLAEAAQ